MAVIATGHREDALEIVQDAMFKLVKNYANKPSEEWGPLFTRIVQSTIRDWYRRHKVRNGLRQFFLGTTDSESSDIMDTFEHPSTLQPDGALKQNQAMQALDTALHALPLRQQQAFLLREWQGLDVQQTAQAMGCSEGSVKTHLSRAITTLKDRLKDHRP